MPPAARWASFRTRSTGKALPPRRDPGRRQRNRLPASPAGRADRVVVRHRRLAAQNDRTAFVENVLEQLLALLGEAMPPLLTDSISEVKLLASIKAAADSCRARGERLVLLVDGLDEDRGMHEHSIAAMLPVCG
jgi:hypothetical protein